MEIITLENSNADAEIEYEILQEMSQKIFQQINQFRQLYNLKPLTLLKELSEHAKQQSEAMALKRKILKPQNSMERLQRLLQSMKLFKVSENVASLQGECISEELAIQFWLKSKSHRQTILGKYQFTGVGVAKNKEKEYYFTQVFVEMEIRTQN